MPDQTWIEYLEGSVAQAESMVLQATAAGSWQAAIAGKRLAIEARRELEQASATRPMFADPTETMSDEQLVAQLVESVAGWPDSVLEAIEDRILALRTGKPVLQVVKGGGERG